MPWSRSRPRSRKYGHQHAEPVDYLLPEDRQWLERMADVLPDSMAIDGTWAAELRRVDPRIMAETSR